MTIKDIKYKLTHRLPIRVLEFASKKISDENYIKWMYRLYFGKRLDLNNPRTFNEKLNWLKLYYHNPIMTVAADKFWAKKFIGNIIGFEYIVPCYGSWKSIDEVDFSRCPDTFFLKSNQDSGGGMLVKKNEDNLSEIRKRFSNKNIAKKNWFYHCREWAYKYIEPRILAEFYLDEKTGKEIHDYKFWCFNGKPIYMYITNKGDVIKENFYDMEFNPVPINHGFERTIPEYQKPENFDIMKKLAGTIAQEFPFVRVDFFNVNGKVYFGECTFYDWGGIQPFVNEQQDLMLGNLLKLPGEY